MTRIPEPVGFPAGTRTHVDVYKAGMLAARMWREGETVSFAYDAAYRRAAGPPVAFSLPTTSTVVRTDRLRLPPFFAGLLPEGESRRRDIQRAYHLADDDELGLLAVLGGDMVGDVQAVPSGDGLPTDLTVDETDWQRQSFAELWAQLPGPRTRAALAGVQPKMSARSRSLSGMAHPAVILKFAIEGYAGVLSNEAHFMARARDAGLESPDADVVTDREDRPALAVVRFDRTVRADGTLVRHAQEDASQVLGIRPGEKYDPDARTVVAALAGRCAAPRLAVRNLFHQLVYSYAIGNNDVHAKNLSVRRHPDSNLWSVTPVYDVLHTWPYEGDHRFFPAIDERGPHDAVTRKRWLALAHHLELPERAAARILDRVAAATPRIVEDARHAVDLPAVRQRDLARVIRRRTRNVAGQ